MERKTALITGASRGLGYEFAHIYAQHGYDIVVVARSAGKLYQLKAELESRYHMKVWVFAQDLSKPDAAYEIFDFTMENDIDIEILVNNAGFGDYGNFTEFDMQKQHELLQVNIMALVELTRYFLPLMLRRKSGRVINLSSVAAFCAGPKMSLYYASKAFVRSFSEAVAEAGYRSSCKGKTLKYYGITVKAMNIGARLLPRTVSRTFARMING